MPGLPPGSARRAPAANPASTEQILVAEIIAPHGVKGAVSAESYSDNPRRFDVGQQLFTAQGAAFTISAAARHKGRLLLSFVGVEQREQAEQLRHVQLFAAAGDTPPLPEGNYYHYQLLGLEVREHGVSRGRITDILSYSANDVYVARDEAGQELLIPALRSVVKRVDAAGGFIEVELPEGLR